MIKKSKDKLSDDDLYEVATYLRVPEAETEIHAEMPGKMQDGFEGEYARLTKGYPLPPVIGKEPLYYWPPGTNKYGKELRIYFKDIPPTPPVIKSLYTDHKKWYAKNQYWRINHTKLVYQLFECGFLLGKNADNLSRIEKFMEERFPPMKS